MTLEFAATFTDPDTSSSDVWQALITNANTGGDNTHLGAVVGALLGSNAGVERLPKELFDGLYAKKEIEKEIDAFVACLRQ